MNKYEIAVIYHPDFEVDITKAEEKVKKLITDNSGKIDANDNWGKKKLAYPIKGNSHGIYVFYNATLPPDSIQKIESTLNITSEVIRFLITKPDLKAIAKADALKKEKEAKNASRNNDEAEEEE